MCECVGWRWLAECAVTHFQSRQQLGAVVAQQIVCFQQLFVLAHCAERDGGLTRGSVALSAKALISVYFFLWAKLRPCGLQTCVPTEPSQSVDTDAAVAAAEQDCVEREKEVDLN
jgi:hypothetical protein